MHIFYFMTNASWFLFLVIIFLTSCIEFNVCDYKPGPIIGESALNFDVEKVTLRTQECPIGNLVSDAIFWYSTVFCQDNHGTPCPDLALINAGAIRQETACGTRKRISKGALYLSDVEQLLPFPNHLAIVRLSGHDIKLALEHAVNNLGRPLLQAASSHFLHVSGIAFNADCREPQMANALDGLRISRSGNRIYNIRLTSSNQTEPLEMNQYYYVATTTYLAYGNDGFLAFLQRDKENTVLLSPVGKPLSQLNPNDILMSANNKPIAYQQALIEWVLFQELNESLISSEIENRIDLYKSCLSS